jgi:hypothetical protein
MVVVAEEVWKIRVLVVMEVLVVAEMVVMVLRLLLRALKELSELVVGQVVMVEASQDLRFQRLVAPELLLSNTQLK